MVTNKGYGLLWDNPSKTTISRDSTSRPVDIRSRRPRLLFRHRGQHGDEIYAGYTLLTGATPMLPKAAYGYIQCKQRYSRRTKSWPSPRAIAIAIFPPTSWSWTGSTTRRWARWIWTPKYWPDPSRHEQAAARHGLRDHDQRLAALCARVPLLRRILKNGWFEHLADGTPINGLPYDRAGSDIDTTNPDAAKWYWNTIHDNIVSKGFDSLWADETEPDLPPNGAYFTSAPAPSTSTSTRCSTPAALYDGFRRDTQEARAHPLARRLPRRAAQRAIFWSSDISPTWDTYKRQIPTGLNFTASGMTYWSNDTGGWQYLPRSTIRRIRRCSIRPMRATTSAATTIIPSSTPAGSSTRTFLPIMRSHGSRQHNEVWSYGKQAEPILEKYLASVMN